MTSRSHRVFEWFREIGAEIQADWERLHQQAQNDPQRAGHGGDSTWETVRWCGLLSKPHTRSSRLHRSVFLTHLLRRLALADPTVSQWQMGCKPLQPSPSAAGSDGSGHPRMFSARNSWGTCRTASISGPQIGAPYNGIQCVQEADGLLVVERDPLLVSEYALGTRARRVRPPPAARD